MTALSPNFSLEEMVRSQDALRIGINNTPDDDIVAELERLCALLLEPVRTLLGVPLHIDSGYRSPKLNAYVHGAADSAHMYGRAADVIPIGVDLQSSFDAIRHSALPFDQLIGECGPSWLHLAIAPLGAVARREAETATAGRTPGEWVYARVWSD
jgi:hypothetical protein